jgi:hypothetical protein
MKDLGIAFIVIGAVISGVSVWLFLTWLKLRTKWETWKRNRKED